MHCYKCGCYLYDGEKICPECGTPIFQTQDVTSGSYIESAESQDHNYPALIGFILAILGAVLNFIFCIINVVYASKAAKESTWENYYKTMATTIAPIQTVVGILAGIVVIAGLVLSIVGYIQTKYFSSLEFKFSLVGIILTSISLGLLLIFYIVAVILIF